MANYSAQQEYEARKSGRQNHASGLRFPLDLGPTGMVMSFQNYSFAGTQGRAVRARTGAITLPIPQSIEDAYGLNIQSRDLGSIGAAVLDVAQGVSEAGGLLSAGSDAVSNLPDVLKGAMTGDFLKSVSGISQQARYFTRTGIDSLAPGVGMALDVANGTTVNPHTTLAFDGVNLKEFTFTWQLSPKNEAESNALAQIRNTIKANILPDVQGVLGAEGNSSLSRAFLSYPNLVHIYFTGLLEDHYIWFKPALVKNFAINFSPQGNVIMQGGKPGFVTMTMTVQEAQIHTRSDYMTGGDAGAVGSLVPPTIAATVDFVTEQEDTASRAGSE